MEIIFSPVAQVTKFATNIVTITVRMPLSEPVKSKIIALINRIYLKQGDSAFDSIQFIDFLQSIGVIEKVEALLEKVTPEDPAKDEEEISQLVDQINTHLSDLETVDAPPQN